MNNSAGNLKAFCKDVNRLSKHYCIMKNRDPNQLFAAVHHELPESMLKYYFDKEFTPFETWELIESQAG